MVNIVKLAATAKRLIEANGRTVTIEKDDRTPATASKPWLGPDDVPTSPDGASESAIMAFVPPSGSGFGSQRVVDGTLQDTVTKIGLVAQDSLTAGVDLRNFTRVVDGSEVFHIQYVDELKPGSTNTIYTLGLVG